jgi:predicted anti-sigma-YlaC factor YlaD
MSDCKDMLGGLSDYLDGNEQTAMCAELRRHMEGCDKCRLVVDSARRTIQLYKGDDLVEFPVEFKNRLHDTLRDAWNRRSGVKGARA